MSQWHIDGEWLLAANRARLARVVRGGLALWDKHGHEEVVLSAADLDSILRAVPTAPRENTGNPSADDEISDL